MSHQLLSISPVDGRYNKVTSALSNYFSEYALIRYRVRVEVEYFIALCELPLPQLAGVPKSAYDELRKLYTDFIPGRSCCCGTDRRHTRKIRRSYRASGSTGNVQRHMRSIPHSTRVAGHAVLQGSKGMVHITERMHVRMHRTW